MSLHDQTNELLGAFALDALDDDETRRVQAHLTGCARCRTELAGLREAAAYLAATSPSRAPSPDLRGRVLAAIERESRPAQRAAPVPKPRRRFAWAALAAALVLAQAGLLIHNLSLSAQIAEQQRIQAILLSQEEAPINLQASDPASDAHGFFRYELDLSLGLINYYRLPPLEVNQSYQCWLEAAGGEALACGPLPVEPDGHGWLVFDLPKIPPARIRVTIETGAPSAPGGPTILAADIP